MNKKKSDTSPVKTWILESAKICYSTLGFEKTTTNKIAIKAGVSIGSLYQYFTNKEAIFLKLTANFIRENESYLIALISSHADKPLSNLIEIVVNQTIDHFLSEKLFLKLVLTKMFEEGFSDLVFNQRKQLASQVVLTLQKIYPSHFAGLKNKEIELAYGFNSIMGFLIAYLTTEFDEEHLKLLKANQTKYIKTILEVV